MTQPEFFQGGVTCLHNKKTKNYIYTCKNVKRLKRDVHTPKATSSPSWLRYKVVLTFSEDKLVSIVNCCHFTFSMFKNFGPSLNTERESMLTTVIQWTIEFCPEFSLGHPNLHKCIGFVYWSGICLYLILIILVKIYKNHTKLYF